ncbi:methyltransferase-like protein 27 isoform X1 [Phaenicophaeus curvirostris]|uniref:methyltransferase-like protein 27 isoform X1 n=1 Tax=Phaenicophaeus curvirostris TaxID=33595 RepID=UPI0037F09E27
MAAPLPPALRERVSAVHGAAALPELLRLYDEWAARYEEDVAALQYRAPALAASALAAAVRGPPGAARVLDVGCGTGLVARELQRHGFSWLDGVDGSAEMLCRARASRLYRELWRCILGSEPLPVPTVPYPVPCPSPVLVPACCPRPLSVGPVPCPIPCPALDFSRAHCPQHGHLPWVAPSFLAGGLLCMTTRSNPSNLRYKAKLEATLERLENQGAWEKVLAQEEERWERATSEEESIQGTGYISGVVYLYRKCPVPPLPES